MLAVGDCRRRRGSRDEAVAVAAQLLPALDAAANGAGEALAWRGFDAVFATALALPVLPEEAVMRAYAGLGLHWLASFFRLSRAALLNDHRALSGQLLARLGGFLSRDDPLLVGAMAWVESARRKGFIVALPGSVGLGNFGCLPAAPGAVFELKQLPLRSPLVINNNLTCSVVLHSGDAVCFDLATGQVNNYLELDKWNARRALFSPSGSMIAFDFSSDIGTRMKYRFKVLDVQNGHGVFESEIHGFITEALAFSPDSSSIAFVTVDDEGPLQNATLVRIDLVTGSRIECRRLNNETVLGDADFYTLRLQWNQKGIAIMAYSTPEFVQAAFDPFASADRRTAVPEARNFRIVLCDSISLVPILVHDLANLKSVRVSPSGEWAAGFRDLGRSSERQVVLVSLTSESLDRVVSGLQPISLKDELQWWPGADSIDFLRVGRNCFSLGERLVGVVPPGSSLLGITSTGKPILLELGPRHFRVFQGTWAASNDLDAISTTVLMDACECVRVSRGFNGRCRIARARIGGPPQVNFVDAGSIDPLQMPLHGRDGILATGTLLLDISSGRVESVPGVRRIIRVLSRNRVEVLRLQPMLIHAHVEYLVRTCESDTWKTSLKLLNLPSSHFDHAKFAIIAQGNFVILSLKVVSRFVIRAFSVFDGAELWIRSFPFYASDPLPRLALSPGDGNALVLRDVVRNIPMKITTATGENNNISSARNWTEADVAVLVRRCFVERGALDVFHLVLQHLGWQNFSLICEPGELDSMLVSLGSAKNAVGFTLDRLWNAQSDDWIISDCQWDRSGALVACVSEAPAGSADRMQACRCEVVVFS